MMSFAALSVLAIPLTGALLYWRDRARSATDHAPAQDNTKSSFKRLEQDQDLQLWPSNAEATHTYATDAETKIEQDDLRGEIRPVAPRLWGYTGVVEEAMEAENLPWLQNMQLSTKAMEASTKAMEAMEAMRKPLDFTEATEAMRAMKASTKAMEASTEAMRKPLGFMEAMEAMEAVKATLESTHHPFHRITMSQPPLIPQTAEEVWAIKRAVRTVRETLPTPTETTKMPPSSTHKTS